MRKIKVRGFLPHSKLFFTLAGTHMAPQRSSMRAPESKPAGARVMIVDDEPDGARSLARLLELRGCTVHVTTDGTQALDHLRRFVPEVLLLDIAMPKVSGYDLARQIRAHKEFESLPIIAVSGYGDREHQALSLAAGCSQHLVKPVMLPALEEAILHEIEKRLAQTSGS
jgi:CheY-like chemotaxis protein